MLENRDGLGVGHLPGVTLAQNAVVLAAGKGSPIAVIGGIVVIILARAAYVFSRRRR
jgi:LPXTG-motif cell wall-anchored protein